MEPQEDKKQLRTKVAKTTTGIPVNQAYTPPVAGSERAFSERYRKRSVLEDLFPEEMNSKRPCSDTIRKPIADVAANLASIEKFPEFFEHLEKVETQDEQANWYFESDESFVMPMKRLAQAGPNIFVWKTDDAVGFEYTLALELIDAPAGRGTIARIITAYSSKSAGLLAKLEAIFGKEASMAAKRTLQRFKAYCETGHVPTVDGQPSGRDEDSYVISPKPDETTLKH